MLCTKKKLDESLAQYMLDVAPVIDKGQRNECRKYYCKQCDAYHLTSQMVSKINVQDSIKYCTNTGTVVDAAVTSLHKSLAFQNYPNVTLSFINPQEKVVEVVANVPFSWDLEKRHYSLP